MPAEIDRAPAAAVRPGRGGNRGGQRAFTVRNGREEGAVTTVTILVNSTFAFGLLVGGLLLAAI